MIVSLKTDFVLGLRFHMNTCSMVRKENDS